jgi:hypothetical protein
MRPDNIQAFQTYVAFNGDMQRTAVALNISVQEVQGMASAGNWAEHAKEWQSLREGSSQDVSIQVNRAVNFVQAHRLRGLIDKVVGKLSEMEPEALMDLLTTKVRIGDELKPTSFSVRQLTDLTKAAEAAHLMTQRALGDTTGEQAGKEAGVKGSSIALLVQQAMSAAEKTGISSSDVVREQLKLNDPAPNSSREA